MSYYLMVEYEDWKVSIVDAKSGDPIQEAWFIITDIDKEFVINDQNNKISLPSKSNSEKDRYPNGYTTITVSKGYYTRIDHNFKIGGGEREIRLDLNPMEPMSNKMVDEIFHNSSNVELAEFLDNYKADPYLFTREKWYLLEYGGLSWKMV